MHDFCCPAILEHNEKACVSDESDIFVLPTAFFQATTKKFRRIFTTDEKAEPISKLRFAASNNEIIPRGVVLEGKYNIAGICLIQTVFPQDVLQALGIIATWIKGYPAAHNKYRQHNTYRQPL